MCFYVLLPFATPLCIPPAQDGGYFSNPDFDLGHIICFGQRNVGRSDSTRILNLGLRRPPLIPLSSGATVGGEHRLTRCWSQEDARRVKFSVPVTPQSCTWKQSCPAKGSPEQTPCPQARSQIQEKYLFLHAIESGACSLLSSSS